jgi:gamma-glutamyltranspeptidase/glutathione hydrolase
MIATSQPLASAAGLRVLQNGGNAVDAAVTAAAVLAVVEPTMNGIGGDLFAIVHDGRTRTLSGLNASGRSPAAATRAAFTSRGLDAVPGDGPLSVSVPGVVDGWSELLGRFGTITLDRALEPAIAYARDGFPVSRVIARQWEDAAGLLERDPAAARTFLIAGRPPAAGDVFCNPALAGSLETVAREGRDAMYRGRLAAAIAADMAARNGLLTARDLAEYRSDWVDPIRTTYQGCEVFELPPNTQGFVALEMLNILEGFDLAVLGHNSAAYLHLIVEAKRIAFADRAAYLADGDAVPPELVAMLLSKEYAAQRRTEIAVDRAARLYRPAAAPAGRGDTVYLTAADDQGNAISLIQSLFESFGAGIVAGATGIALHNRGCLFSLEDGHPNCVAPKKRPLHTLIPAMVKKDGRLWLSYGVMGGDMQPQGHVQVLLNLLHFGMNIQEAGEAARVRHVGDRVACETGISVAARDGLRARGHVLDDTAGGFGGFQGILIDSAAGVLIGGSDPRKDGCAIGW